MNNTIIQIWKNKGKILEGITNRVFKKEHVEQIAAQRMAICNTCTHIDREGGRCAIPGTQPCCGLCGCSLGLKIRSLSSYCDDERWGAVLTQDEEDKLKAQLESEE